MTFNDLFKSTKNCVFYLWQDDKPKEINRQTYEEIKDKEIGIKLLEPKIRFEQMPASLTYEAEPYCQVIVELIK